MINVRERLSERFDRARLRLELGRSVRPGLTVLAGLLVAFACMAFIGSNISRELYVPSQTVRFEVDSARAVRDGIQDVRVKGIKAGAIKKVELIDGRAVITASVEDEYGPIYRDARASLRPQTVLQDMYLDIVDRGTPAAGEAGDERPVPAGQTETAVNVADVLQIFSPATRERLTRLLAELGGGLDDRGEDLREAFARVAPFVEVAGRLSDQLARRAKLTRRMVRNASLLTGELARRERDLRTLVGAGAATLRTTADGSADLEDLLGELPPTLEQVDGSFAAVRDVLDDVDGAAAALRPVAAELPAGLEAVRSLAAAADPAVQALGESVRRLVPLADALEPVSARLRGATGALRPQVPDIDHVTLSAASCLYPLERFFQWTPSVFKMSDARGVAPRAYATAGVNFSPSHKDPTIIAGESCAAGKPIADEPGPGGAR